MPQVTDTNRTADTIAGITGFRVNYHIGVGYFIFDIPLQVIAHSMGFFKAGDLFPEINEEESPCLPANPRYDPP